MIRHVARQDTRRTARDRIWHSVRILRRFTYADVATAADAGYDDVKTYLGTLRRVGVIRITGRAATGRRGPRTPVMNLVRDLGPLTPRRKRGGKAVYDPNAHEVLEADDG